MLEDDIRLCILTRLGLSNRTIGINELHPERLRPLLISKAQQKRAAEEMQLKLDFGE